MQLSTHLCAVCCVWSYIQSQGAPSYMKRNAVKSIPSSKRAAAVQFLYSFLFFSLPCVCDAPPDAEK